jgi:hypothetical protein
MSSVHSTCSRSASAATKASASRASGARSTGPSVRRRRPVDADRSARADHARQVPAGALDQRNAFAPLRVGLHDRILRERLREADDRVQRRAQLMAHAREELGLGQACGLGRGAGLLRGPGAQRVGDVGDDDDPDDLARAGDRRDLRLGFDRRGAARLQRQAVGACLALARQRPVSRKSSWASAVATVARPASARARPGRGPRQAGHGVVRILHGHAAIGASRPSQPAENGRALLQPREAAAAASRRRRWPALRRWFSMAQHDDLVARPSAEAAPAAGHGSSIFRPQVMPSARAARDDGT